MSVKNFEHNRFFQISLFLYYRLQIFLLHLLAVGFYL